MPSFALRSQCITSSSIHSYNSFIHSFFQKGQCIHTCHLRHTHDIVQSYLPLLLLRLRLLFFIPPVFFSLTCMLMCALLSLKIFSKRARTFIYIASIHTNIVTSTYVSIIFYHLFFPLKYLSRFIHRLTYNFFSSFIVHIF